MYTPLPRSNHSSPSFAPVRGPLGAPISSPATRRPLFQASPSMRMNPAAGTTTTTTSSSFHHNKPTTTSTQRNVRVQRPISKLVRQPSSPSATFEMPSCSPNSNDLHFAVPSPTTLSHRQAAMEILASPNPRCAILVQSGELALLSGNKGAKKAPVSTATKKLDAIVSDVESEQEQEKKSQLNNKTITKSQKIFEKMRMDGSAPMTKTTTGFAARRQQGHQRSESNASSSSSSSDASSSSVSSTMSVEKRARTRAVIVDVPHQAQLKLRHVGGKMESIASKNGSVPTFLKRQTKVEEESESESGDSYSTYSSTSSDDDVHTHRQDFACDSSDSFSSSSASSSSGQQSESESELESESESDASSISTFVRQGTASRVARTPLHSQHLQMQKQQAKAKAEAEAEALAQAAAAAAAAEAKRKAAAAAKAIAKAKAKANTQPIEVPLLQSEDVSVNILDDSQLEEAYLDREELIERIRLRLVHAFPSLIEGEKVEEEDVDKSVKMASSPVLKYNAEELANRAQLLEIEIENERTEELIKGEVIVESRTARFVRTPTASDVITPKASKMTHSSNLTTDDDEEEDHSAKEVPDVWQLPIETSTLYKRRSQANKASGASKVFQLPQFDQVLPCQSCDGKMRLQCRYCCGIPPDECPQCDGTGLNSRGRPCGRCEGQGFRSCIGCVGRGYVNCDECQGVGQYQAQYEVQVTQNMVELPASRVEDFSQISGNATASPIELINTAKQQIAAAAQTLSRGNATSPMADMKSPIAATCIWQSTIVRVVSVRIPDEEDVQQDFNSSPNTVTVRIFAVPADPAMPIEEVTDDDDIFEMVASQIQARELAPDRYEQRPSKKSHSSPEAALLEEEEDVDVVEEDEDVVDPVTTSRRVHNRRPATLKVATAPIDDDEEYESSEEVYNVYLQRSPLPTNANKTTTTKNQVRFAQDVEAIPSPVMPLNVTGPYANAPASPMPLLPLSPSVCPRIGSKYDMHVEQQRQQERDTLDLSVNEEDTAAVLAFLNQQQPVLPSPTFRRPSGVHMRSPLGKNVKTGAFI